MSIEKHKAFLDSLEPEKGLPEEMHGWRFDEPLEIVCNGRDRISVENFTAYILERCRRAESRQIPDLKEKVKELVRYAMDAVQDACEPNLSPRLWCERTAVAQKFYILCAPEVKP